MWFRLCVGVVLVGINLAKHDLKNAIEGNKEETETIFASVIKNITRVNNVLQELINNYEHLQKIYKSQENIQSESSDGEIDDVYRNKNKFIGRGQVDNDSPTTALDDGYPATQMIWSEQEEEETQRYSSEYEQALNVTENKLPEKSPPDPPEPAEFKQAEIIFVDSRKPDLKKKPHKLSSESKLEISVFKATTKHSMAEEPVKQQQVKQKKKIDEIYLSLEEDSTTKTKKASKRKEEKTKPSKVDTKKKVEKKVHAEEFSPVNIWDDIISNKPIQLQAHSELSFEKLRKDNNDKNSKEEVRSRSKNTEGALIIYASGNQTKTTNRSKQPVSDSDAHEENRDELQATVLREAYGDACLKVVIRKCFKACKTAGKVVCERYKCKSSYKEKFREYTKTGCIREFRGNSSGTIDDSFDEEYRGNEGREDGGPIFRHDEAKARSKTSAAPKPSYPQNPDIIEDMTRNSYMRSCLPHIHAGSRRSGKLESPNATISNPGDPLPNFNILRDQYERACQQISYERCKRACGYAYTEVCKSFTCKHSRKKAYKKQCNTKCKSAYKKGRSSSSSSSSSSLSSGSSRSSSG